MFFKRSKIILVLVIVIIIVGVGFCENVLTREQYELENNILKKSREKDDSDEVVTFKVESLDVLKLNEDFYIEDYYITNLVTRMNHYYIDENNVLWGIGYNKYGQLGNGGAESEVFYNEPMKIAEDVLSVDASDNGYFCIYLTMEGKLYGVGVDMQGLFTYASETDKGFGGNDISRSVTKPILLMEEVVQASAGREAIVALKKDGSVWWWGQYRSTYNTKKHVDSDKLYWKNNEDKNNPVKMFYSEPTNILENCMYVVSGNFTGAAINNAGELYTWGLNIFGECGTEVGLDDFLRKPKRVLDNVKMVWPEKIAFNSLEQELSDRMEYDTDYNFNMFVMLNDGTILAAGKGIGNKTKEIEVTGDLEKVTTSVYSDEFVPVKIEEYSEIENREILNMLEWGMDVSEVEKILTDGELRYQAEIDYITVEDSRYILYFSEKMKLTSAVMQDGGSRNQMFIMGMSVSEIKKLVDCRMEVQKGDDVIYWCQEPINNIFYGFCFENERLCYVIESQYKISSKDDVGY